VFAFRNQDCTDISELTHMSENEEHADDLVRSFSILSLLLLPNDNVKASKVENVGYLASNFVVFQ
jgi:hypothetical protein